MARAMATPWRWPPDSSSTVVSGERERRSMLVSDLTACSAILALSIRPMPPICQRLNGSRPMKMFRAMDICGTIAVYW